MESIITHFNNWDLNCVKLFQQVNFEGITGPVRFSQDGKRAGVQLEILNLRKDSFRKVSTPKIDHSFPWEKKGKTHVMQCK